MEKERNDMQELGEKIVQYTENRIEHTKLTFAYSAIGVGSQALTWIILLMVFFVFYFCLICGASLWLGEILGASYLGFFMMMGIHFLLFLLIYLLRRAIVEDPFKEKLTRSIFNKKP